MPDTPEPSRLTERQKMLAGELSDPIDADLAAGRARARDRVRVGSRSVIGAGSVVTRDVPDGVFAAGNPCRVIREVE